MTEEKRHPEAEEKSHDKNKAADAPAESSSDSNQQDDEVKGYGEPSDGSGGGKG